MLNSDGEMIPPDFFLLLKQLHVKQNQVSSGGHPEVLEAFRWVKLVVDFFKEDIHARHWDQSMERKLSTAHVQSLMVALNSVTFAAVASVENSMLIQQHAEIVHFIEFINTARKQINPEKHNDIINVFYGKPETTIEKYWHYLKRSPMRLLEEGEKVVTKPTKFAQQLDKFKQEVQADISELVSKAGMLYVLGLKIELVHNLKETDDLVNFFSSFERFLDICGLDSRVLRVVSKPIIGAANTLGYFAILLIQDCDHSFSEASLIQTLKEELLRVYRRWSPELVVHITNFNTILRSDEITDNQGEFFLSDFSGHNNKLVWKWIFGFLYYWETYQHISPKFFRHIGQEYAHASRKHDLSYWRPNEPQEIYYPYLLKGVPRAALVWSTTHLSSYAAYYLENLSIVYQEILSAQKIDLPISLIVNIEIFMLSLKEALHIAFETHPSVRELSEFQVQHIEELATRPLLQFIQLQMQQEAIAEVANKLAHRDRSKLLHHFLMIYQQKLDRVEQKAELEAILGLNISRNKGREKLERLIKDFLYPDELFEKRAIKEKPLISMPSLENDTQPPAIVKLIDIPRHQNRLEAVRSYLKSAMKSDVMVVRCRFNCTGVELLESSSEELNLETEKEHALPQQALSKALYTMLHAGKRRMPLSQITAYLGYWEGTASVDGHYTNFAANIFFIFKSHAIQKYEDLHSELNMAWQSACNKFFKSLNPEQAQLYNIIKRDLKYEASCLPLPAWSLSLPYNKNQLLLETINKKRKKEFIEHLSSFVVYKDVLNDKIYQDIPKWLIRGTEGRTRKKTKQTK
ncbi:hypothetical protein [Alkanindiges illinoisensis]|uniref:Uncharacterized protein n=1 Tax=Alkanindiges illinoisensis TaxID=197183 RepID=A0A4Y7XEI3_9GAMM|nr:hypothetical protein [Alkanindiges illinoisensis]TEU28523.1 hypothetical protein E2B99_05910 [Alkanindiges illinoisensis]